MTDQLDVGAGDGITRTADISDDGLYRYSLTRSWGANPWATFIMLNPSTADGTEDDPTIRRCLGFARSWGLDGITVVNLFAYRATDPDDLAAAHKAGVDVVGPENRTSILACTQLASGPIVAAWGAGPAALRQLIAQRVRTLPSGLQCLALTKAGGPRHPLYLPATATLTPWPPTQET